MATAPGDLIRRTSSLIIAAAEEVRQNLENAHMRGEAAKLDSPPGKDSKVKAAIDFSEKFNQMDEHKMPMSDLLRSLDVENVETGLSGEKAKQRLELEGPNALTETKPTHWSILLLKDLTNLFALLLWAGAILCFIVYALVPSDRTALYTGCVILVVIIGVGLSSFYQEMKSRSIMASFKHFTPAGSLVIRDGEQSSIKSADLVRGDIILLKAGDRVPADIRIVSATDMKVDNASLTGESEPQKRKAECTHPDNPLETHNLAFFGTSVVDGVGKGVVVFTGNSTFMGRIASLAGSASEEVTTLQREIDFFIKLIAVIICILIAIFIGFGIYITRDVLGTLTFAIGILVANVPEGLLTSLTVCLTLCAKKMKEKNILVNNLQSVETMGSISVVCSDKTGTLTENKMTTVHLWYDGKVLEADNYQRVADKSSLQYDFRAETFKMFQRCGVLCSDSVFDRGLPTTVGLSPEEHQTLSPEQQQERLEVIKREYLEKLDSLMWYMRPTTGNASEGAIVKFFHPIEDILEFRGKQPMVEYDDAKISIPFNSTSKYQASVHVPGSWQVGEHRDDHVLFIKGAPEKIWNLSTKILNNGIEEPITPEWQKNYDCTNLWLGEMGERVLGFAFLYLPAATFPKDYAWRTAPPNFPMENLTFIGLAALEDPPRKGVAEAVLECKEAGIKVVMVTGDQPVTATAIARKCNIITGKTANELAEELGCSFEDVLDEVDSVVIHGNDLTKAMAEDGILSDDLQGARLARWLSKKEVVFARTTPAQKLIIVEGHQEMGHIVAVTGDGVNDSPAIKKANIGIAMNIVGSDVAKDSADMLLLDDNFCSIVQGIEEGRLMFDNLRKTIIYAMAGNMPELCPVIANMLLAIPMPLTTIFMIIICVVTDVMPSISFSFEDKELDIMRRKPRNADVDHLVTWKLMHHSYGMIGIVMTFGCHYNYLYVLNDYGFPAEKILGLTFAQGCEPNPTDVYDPYDQHAGNTNSNCQESSPDWSNGEDAKVDLRLWFYSYGPDKWGPCEYPGRESEVHEGAYYCYGTEAITAAQGAYFAALIACQWAGLAINRTRILNIWNQGLGNRWTLGGLLVETGVALLCLYVPGLNQGVGGRPLAPLQLFVPAMPFVIILFVYDEGRKLLNRLYREKMGRPGAIEKIAQY